MSTLPARAQRATQESRVEPRPVSWNVTAAERTVLFLDIKRPLRQPVRAVDGGLIAAVSRSPFVRAAPAQHVARETDRTAAWHAGAGVRGGAPG